MTLSEFITPLEVRMLPESTNGQSWVLISPLAYRSFLADSIITVPSGFITDFVSFEPLKNVGQRAAVLHDFLYSCEDVDRKFADRLLHEALDSVGVNRILADIMYEAVRLFGGGHRERIYRLSAI